MSNASFEKLNPDEAGKIAGTSRGVISAWIRRGWLRATNVGSGKDRPRWQIERDDLDETLKRMSDEGKLRVKRRSRVKTEGVEMVKPEGRKPASAKLAEIKEVKPESTTSINNDAYIAEILEENRALRKKIDELKADLEASRKANEKLDNKNKQIVNDMLEVLSRNE